MNCLQAKIQEKAALDKLTPEQKEFRASCVDVDASKFFTERGSEQKLSSEMPLLYKKAGFTQYQTSRGYVMYRTPCGTKVNPGSSKCRQYLSEILISRPDLSCLQGSVKTASPPPKTMLPCNKRRSQQTPLNKSVKPDLAAEHTPSVSTSTIKTTCKSSAEVKSPNAYGYFKQMSAQDQFLATCGSAKISQFFECFAEVARCVRVVDGTTCGGRYGVEEFVDTGTGNEMSFTLVCDKCKHARYFGDACSDSQQKQTAQCGPLPHAENVTGECSIGKTMLYNFLLAGRGMYEQYRAIFGKTGDAYSKGTFDRAVKKCMEVVMAVLDEEVQAVKTHLKANGQWDTCCIGVDGSWCTPGAAAPHGMFCARALEAWGGLLGYYFMSRNDPAHPYLLTSASMEVIGCIKVIPSRVCIIINRIMYMIDLRVFTGVERPLQAKVWQRTHQSSCRW